MNIGRHLTVVLLVAILSTAAHAAPRPAPWTFVVSGDSRNCGDVERRSSADVNAARAGGAFPDSSVIAELSVKSDPRSADAQLPIYVPIYIAIYKGGNASAAQVAPEVLSLV
jgi:hypothetical protein